MSLKKLADKTVESIDEALAGHDLSPEERTQIMQIIGKTLINSVEETTEAYHETTMRCCGPEEDMAHKIRKEVVRSQELMISNLSSMR